MGTRSQKPWSSCTNSMCKDGALAKMYYLRCTLQISRFNLSTAGWQLGPSSSRPVQFMFLANYHRGNPVPLSDLGPWPLLPGLLLPLSLTDAAGMVEITVMARDSGGCDTFVSPSVSVTVQSPSLSSLADHYAGNAGGLASTDDHCSSPSNTTSCASLRSFARRLRCYVMPLKCLPLRIPTGPLPDSIVTSATASLDVQTSTPSTQEDTAALLDSMALAVLALQVCRDVEILPLLQL